MNGDGLTDIVTSSTGSQLSVLLNQTTPGSTTLSFAAVQTFQASGGLGLTTLDMNGDGKPDFAVGASSSSSSNIAVLVNTTATGSTTVSFTAQQTFGTGNGPEFIAAADLNGDGRADLITSNKSTPYSLSILVNTTPLVTITPSVNGETFATGSGSGPESVKLADINGDGKPDLVVANAGNSTVSVFINTTAAGATTPTFAAPATFADLGGGAGISVADMNGDGLPDLVVANSTATAVSVLLSTTARGATTASFQRNKPSTSGAIREPLPSAISTAMECPISLRPRA